MSFKHLAENIIDDLVENSLFEAKVSIDIDWASEDGSLHKPLSKAYGIQIKPGKRMDAIVTGEQKKIIKFLKSVDYDMEEEDIKDLFPELYEAKTAKVTDKLDDGDGMDPVGKGDADIDNDGDVDKSDKYLANRRKAIGKEVKKESVELQEESFTNLSLWMKAVIKAGGASTLSQAGNKFSARAGNKKATFDTKTQKGSISESSESVELQEAQYKDLESWLIAALDPAGSDVSYFGGKFKILVGRGKTHMWDTKKGKGSVSESVIVESKKPSPAEIDKIVRTAGTLEKGIEMFDSKYGMERAEAQRIIVAKWKEMKKDGTFSSLKKESVELDEGFKKGDKVTVKNAKSYNSLAKNITTGVVGGMNGDKVMVKVGTGSMNVDPKDLVAINENRLLKTNKLSSAEYQKAKKLKGFSADDYTWDGDDQLYVKKTMKESELMEGSLGDYKELIKFANSDGGPDKGDMLKAAALMAKGDKASLKKHLDALDSYPVDIINGYMD